MTSNTALDYTPRFVVIGNLGSKRVEAFSVALERLGFSAPEIVQWVDLLDGKVRLEEVVREGDIVRLEWPGRDWEIEKRLLLRGAELTEIESHFRFIRREQLEPLEWERGRIMPSRQWYLGLRQCLREIDEQLQNAPQHVIMNAPSEIEVMLDKRVCHGRMSAFRIPVPPALGAPFHFQDFLKRLQRFNWRRVFVKLSHPSIANGVVAFETDGTRVRALTTIEMVRAEGEVRLYQTRQIRIYDTWEDVAALVDTMCRERVHVERWIPKAGLDGRSFDARVLMIAGRPQHAIIRAARGPLTNLHPLAERMPAEAVLNRIPEEAWHQALNACEAAMRFFPRTLAAGVDFFYEPGFARSLIFELNAWGDYLPDVIYQGRDTYEAEIVTLLQELQEG